MTVPRRKPISQICTNPIDDYTTIFNLKFSLSLFRRNMQTKSEHKKLASLNSYFFKNIFKYAIFSPYNPHIPNFYEYLISMLSCGPCVSNKSCAVGKQHNLIHIERRDIFNIRMVYDAYFLGSKKNL